MMAIAKNAFGAGCRKRSVAQTFHGRLRGDRDEAGRFNRAVRRGQATAASSTVGMKNGEVETHVASLTGLSKAQEKCGKKQRRDYSIRPDSTERNETT